MKLAYNYAKKHSKCLRRKVGALLIPCNHETIILSTNVPVPDSQQCINEGCLRDNLNIISGQQPNICRCVHAEVNLLIQCALQSVSPLNSTVYCTLSPCPNCARILLNARISRLVFYEEYTNTEYLSIFKSSNIKIQKLNYKS